MMKYMKMLFVTIWFAISLIPVTGKESSDADKIYEKMAETLSKVENKLQNKTIAIYGFEVIGRKDDSYGKFATEKLTHYIVKKGDHSVHFTSLARTGFSTIFANTIVLLAMSKVLLIRLVLIFSFFSDTPAVLADFFSFIKPICKRFPQYWVYSGPKLGSKSVIVFLLPRKSRMVICIS